MSCPPSVPLAPSTSARLISVMLAIIGDCRSVLLHGCLTVLGHGERARIPVGQTLVQSPDFRQTAPGIRWLSRVCGGNLFSRWAMVLPGGLRLLLFSSVSLLAANAGGDPIARLTPAAAGPYRVDGNRILDAKGLPYLLRGTELPTLTIRPADIAGDGKEFGAFSASSLISIRQRLNMNAVRLPVSPVEYEESGAYRARAQEVVESANRFELLVILAADPASPLSPRALAHFWTRCASEFKRYPNVFFALAPSPGMGAIEDLVDAVRSGGAEQPVMVDGEFQVHDRNLVYQATPRYATTRTDEDRWREVGFL